MTNREAAEAIYTREFHYDVVESMFIVVCDCINLNEQRILVLCDKHDKSYQTEITRIMGIIEKTHKTICPDCKYEVPVHEKHLCFLNQTFTGMKERK